MLNKLDILNGLKSHETSIVANHILEMVYNAEKSDIDWVITTLIQLSKHHELEIQNLSIICFGHLARLYGTLGRHYNQVITFLQSIINAKNHHSGTAKDALDDIIIFTTTKITR